LDKCNSDEYKKIIQTEIRKQKNTIKLSVADRIATLENTLHKAGRKSIPKYRRLKTLKSVGRRIWKFIASNGMIGKIHGKIDEIGSSIKVREVPKQRNQIGLADRVK
jgi:hypothetical protein